MINVKMYLAGEENALCFVLFMKLEVDSPILYVFLAPVGLAIPH